MSIIEKALQLIINMDSELISIVSLSIKVSTSATLIATFIGLLISCQLAFYNNVAQKTILTLCNSLLGLPPVVLGLCVYLLLSRSGPLGSLGLLYTPQAMILVQTLLVLPIIISLSYQHIGNKYLYFKDLFSTLNMSKLAISLTLIYETRYLLITVILAGFGRAISEVGAVLIVGGNINHFTRIMTTTIAMETNKGNLVFALSIGIILLSIVILINLVAQILKLFNKSQHEAN